jgi:pimeloyl-ACP methyl ester carboxylesterase
MNGSIISAIVSIFLINNQKGIYSVLCKNMIVKTSMMGHSLGGYIAGQFLGLYPQVITKLFLLSPAGVNYPPNNSKRNLEDVLDEQNFFFKLFAKDVMNKIFVEKVSLVFGYLIFRNHHLIIY